MFSRVGFIKHSGSTDEIMDRLKSHKDKYDAMEGLQSVIYVKVSDAEFVGIPICCLLYTSPSPRDRTRSRMPSSA